MVLLVFLNLLSQWAKISDYGTSFSRDHLAFSTSEDVFKDESITFIKTKKNTLDTGLDILKNTLLSLFLIKKICKKYLCILQTQRYLEFGFEEQVASSAVIFKQDQCFLVQNKKRFLKRLLPTLNTI